VLCAVTRSGDPRHDSVIADNSRQTKTSPRQQAEVVQDVLRTLCRDDVGEQDARGECSKKTFHDFTSTPLGVKSRTLGSFQMFTRSGHLFQPSKAARRVI
jgi:hypothetical protein